MRETLIFQNSLPKKQPEKVRAFLKHVPFGTAIISDRHMELGHFCSYETLRDRNAWYQ